MCNKTKREQKNSTYSRTVFNTSISLVRRSGGVFQGKFHGAFVNEFGDEIEFGGVSLALSG